MYNDEDMNENVAPVRIKSQQQKTIEQRYQKKTLLEQILLRPDTYIGSVTPDSQHAWVWSNEQQRMIWRSISYPPGLYKIFDEILVNAADVKARQDNESTGQTIKHKMTILKVDIDRDAGYVSVYNNGDGIPIEVHKEHQIHVPELIFGHLLTSDNYDDTELRVTGGRNGYGAKLTNIFSKEMTVECCDGKKKFKMTWRDNMSSHLKAKVSDSSGHTPYVKVTFQPDLSRFGIDRLDDDIIDLMTKRVYDLAGTMSNVKVYLNGQVLPVKDFKSYVSLYFDKNPSSSSPSAEGVMGLVNIHEKAYRWEAVISQSTDAQFQQVSFVNSICTTKGGTHVAHVVEPLIQAILKKVTSKNKGGMILKGHHVKGHLWVFVNCLIVNPLFDSQAKETLTSKVSSFGSRCTLSDKTVAAVVRSPIVDSILLWAQVRQEIDLKKKMKAAGVRVAKDRITGIPKLEDANDAGTRHSQSCTLIVTEGDSAKTSCLAGLSVVGRDRYGIFPLRGKLLNVREATYKQQIQNAEIQNVMSVMGLKVGDKDRVDTKGLRYGSIMVMTDQDFDGSHIKGLAINMIHHYWPGLAKCPGFVKQFVTPIIKVTRHNTKLSFFSMPEFEEWKKQNNDGKGWKLKYYKGLGTSTDREFKEYFSKLEDHKIDFEWTGIEDEQSIDMAFSSKKVEERKQWISNYREGGFLDYNIRSLSYKDFVNKELILFSRYDVERSIPSVLDGFKPGQRKVLFGTIKKNFKMEVKIAQLSGYIAEHACYHHGETSLQSTIVAMAQDFVGSNNINILEPCGQFGSRKEGGKDASAARYIFTRLTQAARIIFNPADDPILPYQTEDGMRIEPKFYVPVIPMNLVNGAEGIGTGWSSFVPNFNPRDIIENLRNLIKNEPMEPMSPWYRGFKGMIERQDNKKIGGGFDSVGIIKKIDDETVEITELPVRCWTQNYKEMLEDALMTNIQTATSSEKPQVSGGAANGKGKKNKNDEGADAKKKNRSGELQIIDYRDNSTHDDIHFTVKLSKTEMERAEKEGLEKHFKLRKALPMTNMTLFDSTGSVYRYAAELDIMRDFAKIRLDYYIKRKEYRLSVLYREQKLLSNKVRFILGVCEANIFVAKKKKTEIVTQLISMGFDKISTLDAFVISCASEPLIEPEQGAEEEEGSDTATPVKIEDDETTNNAKEFDYLVGMPLWNLTVEKTDELQRLRDEKETQYNELKEKSVQQLWLDDLDDVVVALDKQDAMDEERKVENKKFKRIRRTSLTDVKDLKTKTNRRPNKNNYKSAANKFAPSAKTKMTKTVEVYDCGAASDASDESTSLSSESPSDDEFSGGEKKRSPKFKTRTKTSPKPAAVKTQPTSPKAKAAINKNKSALSGNDTTRPNYDKETDKSINSDCKPISLFERLMSKKSTTAVPSTLNNRNKRQATLQDILNTDTVLKSEDLEGLDDLPTIKTNKTTDTTDKNGESVGGPTRKIGRLQKPTLFDDDMSVIDSDENSQEKKGIGRPLNGRRFKEVEDSSLSLSPPSATSSDTKLRKRPSTHKDDITPEEQQRVIGQASKAKKPKLKNESSDESDESAEVSGCSSESEDSFGQGVSESDEE